MFTKKFLKIFDDIEEDILIRVLFEMNRFYDVKLKDYYAAFKKNYGRVLDSFERKMLRSYYYYGNVNILESLHINEFPTMKFIKSDIKKIEKLTLEKLDKYGSKKIIQSVKSKIKEMDKYDIEKLKADKWFKDLKNDVGYDFVSFYVDCNLVKGNDYFKKLLKGIVFSFEQLKNYRYIAVVFPEKIIRNGVDISWSIIFRLAVYMENFKSFDGDFFPFKKGKKVNELIEFLKNNKNIDYSSEIDKLANDYYSSISTGFVFNDLLISDNQEKKILIMKKIVLDNSAVSCPSCCEKIIRGNSYPLMFLRSWECQNPACPERSKSGRGKRFDQFGVYRYFKLVQNCSDDVIDRDMYHSWRRDIFSNDLDIDEMLLMYYSWSSEKVLFIHHDFGSSYKGRNVSCISYDDIGDVGFVKDYEDIPLYKLLSGVLKYAKVSKGNLLLKKDIEIFNEDSTKGINNLVNGQISCAVTSPPYYNAREYSQWPNFVLYLIDMMLNAYAVYCSLETNSRYLYNIGDIVGTDNVYVNSNMSNRRIMLGFYSLMFFDIVGFDILGDKIWDKGEVESKRNSTTNLFSGYVKYVNCYEHILVLGKECHQVSDDNFVYKIKPVYKINSKGENILGHTAPFPLELVDLVNIYIDKNKYLLDPFLGSGTSGIWAKMNHRYFVGFELNSDYFELSKDRIGSVSE